MDLTDELKMFVGAFHQGGKGLVFGSSHWCIGHAHFLDHCYMVEPDEDWHRLARVHLSLYRNDNIILLNGSYHSIHSIMPKPLDLVVIDIGNHAHRCAVEVLPYLAPGAMVIAPSNINVKRWYRYQNAAGKYIKLSAK